MLRNLHGVVSFVCLCVLLGNVSPAVDLGTLVQINVLFRHGTRNPFVAPYPTSSWPKDAISFELTTTGMMELFKLGQVIKERYISGQPYSILTAKYDSTRILVNSSMTSRTLESAYSFLAGLYPPQGEQIWNPQLPWQPIPVYARDPWNDPVLNAMYEPECPTLKRLHAIEEGKYKDKLSAEYKDFFKYLDEKTGYKPGTTDIQYAYFIHDTLEMERGEGIMPDWANEKTSTNWTVFEELERLASYVFRGNFINGDLKKIVGGGLVNSVTGNMKNATSTDVKAFVYSVHEDNLAAMLSCFGLFYNDDGTLAENINPASVAIFELYKNEDKYYVRLAYKDGLADSFRYLNIPGCGSNDSCPLTSFESVGEHCILRDWKATCGLKAATSSHGISSSTGMMVGIVGSVLLICIVLSAFFIFVAVFSIKKSQNTSSNNSYQAMD